MLVQGDCYEIIPTLPDSSIDLVITDPPYHFDAKGNGFFSEKHPEKRRKYADALMSLECCKFEPKQFLDMLLPKMKKFYGFFFCNKVLVVDYITWAKLHRFLFDIFIMAKSNPLPAHSTHHLNDMEYCIMIREPRTYFSKDGYFDDYRKWYLKSCKKGLHPAEKPVGMLERFVRVSCPDGGIVLDPFMGSGSTGVACVRNGRSFIGIEKNQDYFNLAKKRIDDENGVGTLFGEAI